MGVVCPPQSAVQVVGTLESKLDALQLERELLGGGHVMGGMSATLSSNASTAHWPKVRP